jgi:hypothetical protein
VTRGTRSWTGLAVALVLAAAWAMPAGACPVCYGEASGSLIDGTKLSVAFLGALVYLVLFGGVGMVFMARRRALGKGDPQPTPRPLADTDDDRSGRPQPAGEETSE